MSEARPTGDSCVVRKAVLDLFCCAGGVTKGYQRAGFYVVGVDIDPQPNYCGDDFIQADAFVVLDTLLAGGSVGGYVLADFVAIHASPPCQSMTAYRRKGHGVGDGYLNLIPDVRWRLRCTGLPYIIENVEGARKHMVEPARLCGSTFRLDVRRHRLFETNWGYEGAPCDHSWQTPRFPPATNRTNLRRTVEVGVWRIPLDVQQKAMGIDWTTLRELSEAIPPAYTEHIGGALMAHLGQRAEGEVAA